MRLYSFGDLFPLYSSPSNTLPSSFHHSTLTASLSHLLPLPPPENPPNTSNRRNVSLNDISKIRIEKLRFLYYVIIKIRERRFIT